MPNANDIEIGDTVLIHFNFKHELKDVVVVKIPGANPEDNEWIFRVDGELYLINPMQFTWLKLLVKGP